MEIIEFVKTRQNELHPTLMHTNSLALLPEQASPARLQMFGSQLSQALPVHGCTERTCFTGAEFEFAKSTFSVRIPHDARILKVLHRYPTGYSGIKENPEVFVIYEYDEETNDGKKVNLINYVSYRTHFEAHQQFGFKYNVLMNSLPEYIEADTIIAQSPTVSENGFWRYGIETNIANMSVPGIIEDGVIASESWCKRAAATCVETYVVNWGKNYFPLNVYGDEKQYKICPDIGDYVNEAGILMALREYDDKASIVTLSEAATRKIDHKYDRLTRVHGGAKVIDVRVQHDTRFDGNVRGKSPNTPEGMSEQPKKYYENELNLYRELIKFYEDSARNARGRGGLNTTPKFNCLIDEAYRAVGLPDQHNMVRSYRNSNIDEWRIEITIEYTYIPGVSSKLSGTHGNKGIIVQVWPDEDMPVDTDGNRADLIMDGLSMIKRMIISAPTETFITASERDARKKLKQMVNEGRPYEELAEYAMNFYRIINPLIPPLVSDENGLMNKDHFNHILNDKFHCWMPTNNPAEPLNILYNLAKYYPPLYGPVTYRGQSGNMVTTKRPVLIGSAYIIVIEKTGNNWTGVASSKLNNFGVPAKITSSDRHAAPARNMPIRFGESEVRLFTTTAGARNTADLFDRTNSSQVRKAIQETIYRSDKPSAIDVIVDRTKYSRGNGRIHALVKHLGQCAGWVFSREILDAEVKDK